MDLSLAAIEVFLAFAEARNAQEAANALGISLPTLHERLRAIEERLPQSPFAWQGRKRILSPSGKRLAEHLRPRAAQLRQAARTHFAAEHDSRPPRFRIAGRAEILTRIALAAGQGQRLVLRPCSSREAFGALIDGQVDVALTHPRPRERDLIVLKLFEPAVGWICARSLCPAGLSAAKASSPGIPWHLCQSLPFVAYKEDDSLLKAFAQQVNVALAPDSVWLTCENWMVVRDLVAAGKGAAIVPIEAVGPLAPAHFVTIPLPKLSGLLPFFAVYRRELRDSSHGKSLAQLLRGLSRGHAAG